MNDAEIITALKEEILLAEYANNSFADCVSCELLKSSLDLIKRQQSEIKSLKEHKEILIKKSRTEAITAFGMKLLKFICLEEYEGNDFQEAMYNEINKIANEMTGGEENESK